MAILNILRFPDPRLRKKAEPVTEFTDELHRFIDDMFETMYDAPGIGLAATQVDFHQRVIVIDISEDKSEPLCLINPELLEYEGKIKTDEGCLSVPNIYEPVERFGWVKIAALDKQGQTFELEASDLLAVCIQHEMDHLEGKVFVDYLSTMKKMRIKKKMEKLQRQTL